MKIFITFVLIIFAGNGEIMVKDYERELSKIKLLFYPSIQLIDDPWELASTENSRWKIINFHLKDVKVLIHGWNAAPNHISVNPVLNAYLKVNSSHVLAVDWQETSTLPYIVARHLITEIAYRICKKLSYFIEKTAVDVRNLHVIGHSLGCHIATHVGRCFNGDIGRLTALDPAGPFFTKLSTDAYSKNDFLFVDSIHTSAGVLGEFEVRGHAAFFPNRGIAPQPGCETIDLFSFTACSHFRVSIYFAESILLPKSFQAHKCELSLIQFPTVHGNCMNGSDTVEMGEDVDRRIRGTFYVATFSSFPFGKNEL